MALPGWSTFLDLPSARIFLPPWKQPLKIVMLACVMTAFHRFLESISIPFIDEEL